MLDHEIKSLLCCKTKFVEGIIQEMTKFVGEGVRFNCGVGVVCTAQIPLERPAIILQPSDDEATDLQTALGTLFEIQVTPEFMDV